ncbi:MAG TPA: hypothetical protein P5038_20415 [Candidatus Paceibacterota bacterium]|nr:hypothetical protein [Candidatus Paceibacterota bacterium]
MRRMLHWLAMLVAAAALISWVATGAHRGWTQTSVAVKTVDEVTGLEAVTYEPRFVMGVELLGGGLAGAALLGGAAQLFRRKTNTTKNPERDNN